MAGDGADVIAIGEAAGGEIAADSVDPLIGEDAELGELVGGDGFLNGAVVRVAVVEVVENVVGVEVVDEFGGKDAAEHAGVDGIVEGLGGGEGGVVFWAGEVLVGRGGVAVAIGLAGEPDGSGVALGVAVDHGVLASTWKEVSYR